MNLEGDFERFMNAVGQHPQLRVLILQHSSLKYEPNQESLQKLGQLLLSTARRLTHLHLSDKVRGDVDFVEAKKSMCE